MSSPRVLIVEDDERMREMVRSSVGSCEVIAEATNGREGVAVAELLRPDVILLDISLPGMNGFDAARLLRQRLPDLRIVFVTSHVEAAYVEEARALGAQGYVPKRSIVETLRNAIDLAMSGRGEVPLSIVPN